MNDTDPRVAALMAQRLAGLSGAQRLHLAASQFDSVRAMLMAGLPGEPDPEQQQLFLLRRLYPECADALAPRVAAAALAANPRRSRSP
jgi:hypothetical protein